MTILRPFELLLSNIFIFSYNITGHYGYALLIMSALVTVLSTPLYMLAERWKNKENAVKQKMQKNIAGIKQCFTGKKQYYLIQATHRIYGYKSWYPLQTSMGIIVQIPFFFAAYKVLSGFSGYNNISFGIIKDLAAPDTLLYGINMLPILMTFFNLVSSFYYTKSFRLKDNTQQIILAAVFFLLLYDSPAALLIYWTCNNFLSLLKNIFIKTKNKEGIAEFQKKTSKRASSNTALFIHLLVILYLFVTTAVNYTVPRYNKFILLASTLFLGAYFIRIFFIKKKSQKSADFLGQLYALIPCCIIYTGLIFLYLSKSSLVPRILLVFFLYLIHTALFYILLHTSLPRSAEHTDEQPSTQSYYALIAECILLFSFVLPLQIYANNPKEFFVSPAGVVLHLVCVCAGIFALLFVLAFLVKRLKKAQMFFNCIVLFFVWFCFYTVFLPLNAGPLSEFSFQKAHVITKPAASLYVKDFVILLFSLYTVFYFQKRRTVLLRLCTLLLLSSFTLTVYKVMTFEKPKTPIVSENSKLPETTAASHRLSKTGKNVIFIMPDMMNGNYIQRILDELPQLKTQLSGFVWYENTLSISASTVHSLPAMMGGAAFTPLAMNATENTYAEDQIQSVKKLFSEFLEHKYICTNVGSPMFAQKKHVDKISTATRMPYYTESAVSYTGYWNKDKNIEFDSSTKLYLLSMLPVYNAAPYTLKKLVYQDGSWNNMHLELKNIKAFTLCSYPYLDLMPDIFSATEQAENHFMFIANELTHMPFGINKDGNFLEKRADLDDSDLPYYCAKTFLLKIAGWIDWLKDNGVYDNTLIVIASDHGNFEEDNGIVDMDFKNFGNIDYKKELSRCYPALLVKNFNANEQLQISSVQTQNSDVPLIFNEYVFKKDTSFSDLKKYTEQTPRERTYSLGLYTANDFTQKITIPFSTYKVQGSIHKHENWEHLAK